ncbi:MAG: methyltransferase domain-containing protein [Bacteroidota bacterium]
MSKDPYRRVAGLYDRVFEQMNKGLRVLGIRMFIPPQGGSILDVGCGTGVHLDIYQRYGCKLYGIDTSQSMLELARDRLGESAELSQVDATKMPYESASFDLVLCMLVLHEMDDEVRTRVLSEMKRVIKSDGRLLLIDFHAGKPRSFKGWYYKLVILLSEIIAGRRHFRNYRHFMSIGGLPTLIEKSQFEIEKRRIVGGDTLALYLLRGR